MLLTEPRNIYTTLLSCKWSIFNDYHRWETSKNLLRWDFAWGVSKCVEIFHAKSKPCKCVSNLH